MVAIIKTGHSLQRILNYNENKVKEGVASCLSAPNYPIDVEQLSFKNKLNRLKKQAALNENVTRNSIHISLNFDPSEKLSNEQLKEIANTYMQKIGFGEQPYLVYQHFDAGHPHIHLVSVKIRANGARIDTQNIGRNQSETARKEIETEYKLVKAEQKRMEDYNLKPAFTKKIIYGKPESRRAIANVLNSLLNTYKYTSLPELNALLKLYNVMADRCGESSRIYQHMGLVYRILDDKGMAAGVPIKASLFPNKPTLKYLEKRFAYSQTARLPYKARVKNIIDLGFFKKSQQSLQGLIEALEKEGINTVVRQSADGIIYGITYIDHKTKCIFNGSYIGKQYSAKGILERCNEINKHPLHKLDIPQPLSHKIILPASQELITESKKSDNNILESLLQPEYTSSYVPYHLRKKGGKKRKKRTDKRI